jgi:hypothetical protein
LLAATRLHHVERVQPDQHAARDLEGAEGDAEQAEDQAAAQRERRQRDGAGPRAPPRHETSHLGWVARRHREK